MGSSVSKFRRGLARVAPEESRRLSLCIPPRASIRPASTSSLIPSLPTASSRSPSSHAHLHHPNSPVPAKTGTVISPKRHSAVKQAVTRELRQRRASRASFGRPTNDNFNHDVHTSLVLCVELEGRAGKPSRKLHEIRRDMAQGHVSAFCWRPAEGAACKLNGC
jgi:hypothetical protein